MTSSRRLASVSPAARLALAIGLGGLALAGCDQRSQILLNPTPELSTYTQREADLQNSFSYSANQNFRGLRRDWEVFWLRSDSPSSLTPYPVR